MTRLQFIIPALAILFGASISNAQKHALLEKLAAEAEPAPPAGLKAWPAKSGSQAGAILFSADVDVRNESTRGLENVNLVFTAEDPPVTELFSVGDQAENERLFLLALPPGDYSTTIELALSDKTESKDVQGRFDSFTVKTGQVTVLGSVDFKVHLDYTGVNVEPKFDAKPETRLKLVKDAVEKAESDRPNWTEPLKAALKSLEGDQAKAPVK